MILIKLLPKKKIFHITYGIYKTSFAWCCIGTTSNGICHLSFWESNKGKFIEEIKKDWPNAIIEHDNNNLEELFENIFISNKKENDFTCYVSGTKFQLNVWHELIKIPSGTLITYGKMAQNIGKPKAVRAVGTAIGKNPVSYLIPCHRVISKSTAIHKYRWGPSIKEALIQMERK